jgi:4-hydroxybenzoate polyprenyltransferase
VGSFGLILVCMVAARTSAMGANRLLDADLDRLNPRTAGRAIPAGRLTTGHVALAVAVSALVFILACGGFWLFYGNVWPVVLSVPVLLFLCGYPLLKRFSSLCHFYLGAALALSPPCAWLAITGGMSTVPVMLGLGVLCWTAGFDIIYATSDVESDRATGVRSIPSRLGLSRGLWVSRGSHVAAVGCFAALSWLSPDLQWVWLAAVSVSGVILVVEHRVVRADDLSRVNLSFFTLNGLIAVLLGLAGLGDALLAQAGG